MERRDRLCLLVFSLLAVTALIVIPGPAAAKESYQPIFDEFYGSTGLLAGDCAVCHTRGEKLNTYGRDFKAAYKFEKSRTKASKETMVAAALKAIENLDSDKDAFSNIAEIQAGTNPGDPRNRPVRANSRQLANPGTPPAGITGTYKTLKPIEPKP